MKAYLSDDKVRLVGKAWEVRTYLHNAVNKNRRGEITVSEWLASGRPSKPGRFISKR